VVRKVKGVDEPTVIVALLALVKAGAWSTVSVKFCVAVSPAPLVAVIVNVSTPDPVGVPPMLIEPVPLDGRLTPGIAFETFETASVAAVVGNPGVDVMLNEPAVPTTKVVLLALVIDGAWFTVSVKFCVLVSPAPLVAVIVNVSTPDAVGVPVMLIEPVPLDGTLTPGIAFETFETASVAVVVGKPGVDVMLNEPAVPSVKVVLLALVMDGGASTVIAATAWPGVFADSGSLTETVLFPIFPEAVPDTLTLSVKSL
jgi:hypothetical protein